MSKEREALRSAIDAHAAATKAVKSAETTLTRARSFADKLEADLAAFVADVDQRVAAERADAVRVAMASGETPTFEMSASTKVAVAVRDANDKQLVAAKEAVEALRIERDSAVKAAERCNLDLEWHAERVMAASAGELADEYAATLSRARELYLAMWALSVAPIRRPPEEITRLSPAPTRSLRVSPDVAAAVNAAEIIIETSNTRRDLYRKQMRGAVASWLGELKRDADARLEVPREASAQVKAAAA